MIVLDEEIHGRQISQMIASWYPGPVVSITALRPHTHIQDDAIITLLRTLNMPTFITINVAHFWRTVPANVHYTIVCVNLPDWRVLEIPDWLRQLLRMPEFKTKTARMGKVICLRPTRIEYYESDKRIHALMWDV